GPQGVPAFDHQDPSGEENLASFEVLDGALGPELCITLPEVNVAGQSAHPLAPDLVFLEQVGTDVDFPRARGVRRLLCRGGAGQRRKRDQGRYREFHANGWPRAPKRGHAHGSSSSSTMTCPVMRRSV